MGFLDDLGQDATEFTGSPVGSQINNIFGGEIGAAGSLLQGKNPLKNTPFGSIFGVSTSAQDKAQDNAQQALDRGVGAYEGLQTPEFSPINFKTPDRVGDASVEHAKTVGVSPTAFNNVSTNPAYARAQEAQMAALSNLAANGGRSATTDANLAQIQQEENANARGARDAIMQNANMRGMGGSGMSLLAQLNAQQGAINNQSARDLGVSAQQQQTMLGAGQAAAGIGSNLENQSWNEQAQRAAANDAIDKFNAQNAQGVNLFNAQQGTGVNLANMNKNVAANNAAAGVYNQGEMYNKFQVPQTSYEDAMQRASGRANAAVGATNYYGNQANIAAQQQGNMFGGLTRIGSAAIGANGGGQGGNSGGGNEDELAAAGLGAAAMFASWGGKVPGVPRVGHDSPFNDTVPVATSPGEVVVPRSLALGGTPKQIGHFVQNAPPISDPARKREAMLSALKNMARRH